MYYQRNKNSQKKHTLDNLLNIIHPTFTKFGTQIKIKSLKLKTSLSRRVHVMIL